MGIAVYYETEDAVPADVRGEILAEIEQINEQRDWWCENFFFYDSEEIEDGSDAGELEPLRGSTKISLVAYSGSNGDLIHVEPDDNSLMSWRDTQFIVDQLRRWSAKFGLIWNLEMVGEPIGRIEYGQLDPALSSYLTAMQDFPRVADVEAKAKEISRHYASRNEDNGEDDEESNSSEIILPNSTPWWKFW